MSSLDQESVLAVDSGLVEEEMVTLMAAQESDSTIGNPTSSIRDNPIDYIPAEVLEDAGINQGTSEVPEDQLNALLSLASHTTPVEAAQVTSRSGIKRENSGSLSGQGESLENVTVSLTPEGLVVITDAGQQRFYFTSEQLAANNIDINNLSEDAIHHIISLAFSAHHNDKSNATKRRKVDGSLSIPGINPMRCDVSIHESKLVGHSMSPSTSGTRKLSVSEPHPSQVALIGEEVEVKRDGRLVPAKIRYCRGGGGYKVQFSDGHFEWVGSEQIQVRAGPTKSRNDHESYSGFIDSDYTKNHIGSSGIGRRAPPAIPGIKVTPQNGYEKSGEPNFCCVVCDRKLYQKEVKFLTIRVPACDECTQLKMMVMDTVEEYRELPKNPAITSPSNSNSETSSAQEVANSPRIPEELLEAPPILHRLDSPEENIDSETLKGTGNISNF